MPTITDPAFYAARQARQNRPPGYTGTPGVDYAQVTRVPSSPPGRPLPINNERISPTPGPAWGFNPIDNGDMRPYPQPPRERPALATDLIDRLRTLPKGAFESLMRQLTGLMGQHGGPAPGRTGPGYSNNVNLGPGGEAMAVGGITMNPQRPRPPQRPQNGIERLIGNNMM